MRVLAIVQMLPTADRGKVISQLNDELKASWKLFEQDVLREAYGTDIPGRVVFIFEASDITVAQAALNGLPLVQAGCFDVQLIELRPFANWSRLFAN